MEEKQILRQMMAQTGRESGVGSTGCACWANTSKFTAKGRSVQRELSYSLSALPGCVASPRGRQRLRRPSRRVPAKGSGWTGPSPRDPVSLPPAPRALRPLRGTPISLPRPGSGFELSRPAQPGHPKVLPQGPSERLVPVLPPSGRLPGPPRGPSRARSAPPAVRAEPRVGFSRGSPPPAHVCSLAAGAGKPSPRKRPAAGSRVDGATGVPAPPPPPSPRKAPAPNEAPEPRWASGHGYPEGDPPPPALPAV